MTTFVVGAGSYFIGIIVAVLVCLVPLSLHHGAPQGAILAGLAGLAAILVAVIVGLLVLRRRLRPGHGTFARWPKIN